MGLGWRTFINLPFSAPMSFEEHTLFYQYKYHLQIPFKEKLDKWTLLKNMYIRYHSDIFRLPFSCSYSQL